MKNKIIKSTKNELRVVICALFSLVSLIGVCQNIGINTSGNAPNASAALDIDINQKGLLVPRMSTVNRNAIVSPANSLLIFNTTTDCFEAWNQTTLTWVAFGCISCELPGAFSTSAATSITPTSFSANWTVSIGATAYFLDIATDAAFTSFVSGYNNLNVGNVVTSSVTGLTCATVYYYRVRANNSCGTSANSNTITLTTSIITANAGSDQNLTCGTSTTLAGNATGTWSVVSGTATITTPGSPTSTVTGITGTAVLRWTISNACGTSFDDVTITLQCVTDDAFTVLKLHMDGANGSTTFTDNSPVTPHTITAVGNAQVSTAQSKFCQSGYFDGAGDYLTFPDNADWNFGTGDFTIDFYVNQTSPYAHINHGLLYSSSACGSNQLNWGIFVDIGNDYIGFAYNHGSYVELYGPAILNPGIWYHIAIVRSGNNLLFFVDGVLKGTSDITGVNFNLTGLTGYIGYAIGGACNSNQYDNSYMDEVRISKGIARWTSNFTPPASPYCD